MNTIAAFLQADWAERAGWTLLHSLWQLTAVAAVSVPVVGLALKLPDHIRNRLGFCSWQEWRDDDEQNSGADDGNDASLDDLRRTVDLGVGVDDALFGHGFCYPRLGFSSGSDQLNDLD